MYSYRQNVDEQLEEKINQKDYKKKYLWWN